MTETKRPITAEDLLTLQSVGDPQISPDGTRVAFVRTHTDTEENTYRGEVWMTQADGNQPARKFTGGKWSDGGPRWSPDGSRLAFVSDRLEEKGQIFTISPDGGEASVLTHLEQGGISSLRWSPDGTKIAFLYQATPANYTKKATEEREAKHLSNPPRVHTQLFYRLDGQGYFDGSYAQVYVADAATGEARALTGGPFGCDVPCWLPDGQTLVFASDRRPDADIDPDSDTQLWRVSVDGSELTQIPAPLGDKGALALSPDGSQLAYIGGPDPRDSWGTRNSRVYVLPLGGSDMAHDLTGLTDLAVGGLTIADTGDGSGDDLAWGADGQTLFFLISDRGDVRLASVPASGGDLTFLTPANHTAGGFSLSVGTSAITLGDSVTPGEVFVGDRQVSDLNKAWREVVAVQTPTPLSVPNGAGGTVPGWVLTPPEFEKNSTAPLVLYVHGGPHLQYGNALFHELQWLAASGYVVAYLNPRGSKGYGEAHTSAIKGDWGGPALADVEAVVDFLLAEGYADPQKIAIMGGSYGGYLTAWAVGHTDRFACAVADRLVNNLQSMAGTCDFPWSHGTYYQGNAWDDPSDLWKHSPMAYAGQINTPLLLIHSDGDLRCPVSQAEELFAALRLQRKPVEFVRYPAETSHGLSRGGPPDLRLDRLRRNLGWLDKYLKA